MSSRPASRGAGSPACRHRSHGGCDDVAVQLASGAEGDHGAAAVMTVTVSQENADAAFRSLYDEHRPALLRLFTVLADGDRHRAVDLDLATTLRSWTHTARLGTQHNSTSAK